MPNTFSVARDKPIEHRSSHGNVFKCNRADLGEKIIVIRQRDYTSKEIVLLDEDLIKDVAEFIGWHSVCIRPELNGFQGYDCIHFEYV